MTTIEFLEDYNIEVPIRIRGYYEVYSLSEVAELCKDINDNKHLSDLAKQYLDLKDKFCHELGIMGFNIKL